MTNELSSELRAAIDTAVARFEKSWQLGQRPSIRDFCAAERPIAGPLLKELVLVDLEHRLRAGDAIKPDEYLREFPELQTDSDLIFNLLKVESRWTGEPIDPEAPSVAGGSPLGSTQEAPSLDRASSPQPTAAAQPQERSGPSTPGLGRFRLIEAIGQGAFGTVYRAIDAELGRPVAVKFPRKGSLGTEAERERFFREARSAAALNHPRIVPIYEVGGGERPYIVSAFVKGHTLAQEMSKRRFEFREAAKIVEQLAAALAFAHKNHIIHRDVKPSNIMLDDQGQPFLMDFGLAKRAGDTVLTVDGTILGTPAYMSPEQAAGRVQIDGRGDVYSLGVVLYELLTGARPFQGTVQSVLHQVIHNEPVPPDRVERRVPRDLAMICLKCLQKSPDDRYPTAQEFQDDLGRYSRREPVRARPISLPARGWRWARRHPKTALLAAAVLTLGVTLPIVWTLSAHRVQTVQKEIDQKSRLAKEAQADAERSQEASRERLERLFVSKGNAQIDTGDALHALPWFAAAFERATDSSRGLVDRARLVSTLRHAPRLVQFWWTDKVPSSILSVAHCPGRPLIAIYCGNHKVILRDLKEPADPDVSLACRAGKQCLFSPDGKRLAASSDDGIRIWLASAWADGPRLLKGRGGFPTWMTFHPTSRLLAAAALEEGVQLWDVSSGAPEEPAIFPKETINHLAFNADGSLLALAGANGSVRLWSLATHKLRGNPLLHDGPVNRVCFTPDGRSIVSASDDGTVRMWDVATGVSAFLFQTGSPVRRIATDPNGTLLAAGCRNGAARVWNLKTGSALPGDLHHEREIYHLEFASDGRRLLTGSEDGTARVWDAQTGEAVTSPIVHGAVVLWVELASDGRRIITAGENGQLRTWKLETPFAAELRLTPAAPFASTQLSPDGRWLLLIGTVGRAHLCDLRRSKLIAMPVSRPGATCGAFSSDGQSLVTANKEGKMELWDVSSQRRLAQLPGEVGRINEIAFSPDGHLLVICGSDGVARVLPISGNRSSLTLPHGADLKRAFFSANGHKIYTVGDQSICLWDASSGHGRPLSKNATHINDCRLTTDEHSLVVSDNGVVTFRNAETGAIAQTLDPVDVKHIGVSRDGTRVITGNASNAARVWELGTGKPVTGALQHRQDVTCCTFRGDGLLVATGSEDKAARVWDARTGEAVSPPLRHSDSVIFVAFCADGKELVSVSADGLVRRWPLDDSRSADGLLRQARMTSGLTVDDTATLIPVDVKKEWGEQIRGATSESR